MIVADTNLIAYLLVEGEKTELARSVWKRDPRWMLPTLWRSEFLNVLTTVVRARLLTLDQAHQTWHLALTIFGANEVEPAGDAVLDLAAARHLSACDAQFVVAAVDLDVPLVTSDRRMLLACPDVAIASDRFAG
ncbi:MAG: type II toxin-antitoxin system VapC family toxin [Acidobacteriota bacterium]|nr:type II toxin-antitoxin system VapC family toxin [Acidobacteriota bacterium]